MKWMVCGWAARLLMLLLLPICLLWIGASGASVSGRASGSQLVAQFHDKLMVKKPNVTLLTQIVREMDEEEKPFALNFLYKNNQMLPLPPLLHHLFNLYMTSRNAEEKKSLLSLIHLCLNRGLDVSTPLRDDPPMFFKAAFAKEFDLLLALFRHGRRFFVNQVIARSHWIVSFLNVLYSVPTEVIPLCKLVLHVEKLVHTTEAKAVNSNRTAIAVHLLSSASLGKPSVKASELLKHSSQFRELVNKISEANYTDQLDHSNTSPVSPPTPFSSLIAQSKEISTQSVIASLDELVRAVHHAMWEILSEDSRREVALGHFFDLLLTVNDEDRNAFHYLFLSHANHTISHILEHYRNEEDFPAGWAMMHRADFRGHTPLSYCMFRFGQQDALCTFLAQSLSIEPSSLSVGKRRFKPVERLPPEEREVERSDESHAIPSEAEASLVQEVQVTAAGEALSVEADFGGWDPTLLSEFTLDDSSAASPSSSPSSRCDILEVWNATQLSDGETFFSRYINTGTPVIFRGLALHSTETLHSLRSSFSRDLFLKRFGALEVQASTLPYGDSFGVSTVKKTLAEVASSPPYTPSQPGNLPLYTFQTPGSHAMQALARDVPLPRALVTAQQTSTGSIEKKAYPFELQFYLGAAGTGAPVHVHGHALNTLVYGQKQWILSPPEKGMYSTLPAIQHFPRKVWTSQRQEQEGDGGYRCTQYAGDVLYVPSLWAHGTVNMRQSIGVAHEFSVESFCME